MIGCAVPSPHSERGRGRAKAGETMLRRQTQDLHAVFSQAIVGISRIDTAGRFTLCNPRFCEIVRRSSDALLRQQIQAIVDPDDQPQMLELLGQAIGTGKEFVTRSATCCPATRACGSNTVSRPLISAARSVISWWSWRISPTVVSRSSSCAASMTSWSGESHERTRLELRATNDALNGEIEHRNRVEATLKRDIAQRRAAQRALADSERRFRLLVQGVTDYAIFMLDPDGCVTNWNTGAQRIHQYSEAGDRRPAFRPLLHRGGAAARRTGARASCCRL